MKEFEKDYKNIDNHTAFITAVLLFNKSKKISNLFSNILKHIYKYIDKNKDIPVCLEQPFVVYHCFKNHLYDNKKLFSNRISDMISILTFIYIFNFSYLLKYIFKNRF